MIERDDQFQTGLVNLEKAGISMTWKISLSRFLADDAGQDLIEYALIAAFLGMASVAMLKGVATDVGSLFTSVGTTLTSAT